MSAGVGALAPLTAEQRANFGWLEAPHLRKVIHALESAEKGSARFVGGCVRDSLLAQTPKDFDIATLLEPRAVMAALNEAGLRAVPTGVDHGTVTAIVDHQGVEVTSLRADLSTDGRRATVAYTRDWAVDAGRRDFRINAIYLTPDEKLFNPVGGVEDAQEKRVRFIGDPELRIREDYLRILRFFRFTARFSNTFDEAGLAACAAMADGVDRLSAERVGAEFMAILAEPRASFALNAMSKAGVLKKIWRTPADLSAVERLKSINPSAAPSLALAVLYGDGGDGAGGRLRLSNAEKALRSNALKGAAQIAPGLSDQNLRERIYRLGEDVFSDAVAVACAFGKIDQSEYERLNVVVDRWTPSGLPVSGKDVVAAGVAPGPDVAVILSAVEEQWIAEDFPDVARVREILAQHLVQRRI